MDEQAKEVADLVDVISALPASSGIQAPAGDIMGMIDEAFGAQRKASLAFIDKLSGVLGRRFNFDEEFKKCVGDKLEFIKFAPGELTVIDDPNPKGMDDKTYYKGHPVHRLCTRSYCVDMDEMRAAPNKLTEVFAGLPAQLAQTAVLGDAKHVYAEPVELWMKKEAWVLTFFISTLVAIEK